MSYVSEVLTVSNIRAIRPDDGSRNLGAIALILEEVGIYETSVDMYGLYGAVSHRAFIFMLGATRPQISQRRTIRSLIINVK